MAMDTSSLSPALIAFRTCFIALLGLLIIFSNVLCITVTHRVTNLADSTKVLMTSLAVYDILVIKGLCIRNKVKFIPNKTIPSP